MLLKIFKSSASVMRKRSSITLSEIIEGGNICCLSERVLGRVIAEDIKHLIKGEVLIKKGKLIDEFDCEKIDAFSVKSLQAYSVITCASLKGSLCYVLW